MICKARNNKIFNTKEMEVLELVKDIKVLSWRWYLTRLKSPTFLFYEWCWNPMVCLVRYLVFDWFLGGFFWFLVAGLGGFCRGYFCAVELTVRAAFGFGQVSVVFGRCW
jgi:hypothetical protein